MSVNDRLLDRRPARLQRASRRGLQCPSRLALSSQLISQETVTRCSRPLVTLSGCFTERRSKQNQRSLSYTGLRPLTWYLPAGRSIEYFPVLPTVATYVFPLGALKRTAPLTGKGVPGAGPPIASSFPVTLTMSDGEEQLARRTAATVNTRPAKSARVTRKWTYRETPNFLAAPGGRR